MKLLSQANLLEGINGHLGHLSNTTVAMSSSIADFSSDASNNQLFFQPDNNPATPDQGVIDNANLTNCVDNDNQEYQILDKDDDQISILLDDAKVIGKIDGEAGKEEEQIEALLLEALAEKAQTESCLKDPPVYLPVAHD